MTIATITRPIALIQNASARLPAAMTSPAIDGPSTLDRLNWAELRATALPMADRSTTVDTTAWKAGEASAPTDPATAARTRTCQKVTTPVEVRIARSAATPAPASCVAASSRRRSTRSARTPAKIDRRRIGAVAAALAAPSAKRESVSPRTSQPWAVACIQLPMLPTNAATMNRR